MGYRFRISVRVLSHLLDVRGLGLPLLKRILIVIIAPMSLAPYSALIRRQQMWLESRFHGSAAKARDWTERYGPFF